MIKVWLKTAFVVFICLVLTFLLLALAVHCNDDWNHGEAILPLLRS